MWWWGEGEDVKKQCGKDVRRRRRDKDNAGTRRALRFAEKEKSGEEKPKRGTIYRAPRCLGIRIGRRVR
jgi:hypothetical protein